MFVLLAPLILIVPVVGLPVSYYVAGKPEKFKYSGILGLSLFFAIMGFYFIPKNTNSDLVRYFVNYVDIFRGQQLPQIFHNETTLDKFFFIQNFLFYVSSRFSNDQMLPCLTMFLVFFNGFSIISDFSKENKLESIVVWQMIFFFIIAVTFTTVVNNIRNILGVSFFCVALYRDLYKDKRSFLTLLLYLFGMSTHIAVIGLVFIRILLSFLIYLKNLNILKVIGISLFFGIAITVLLKTGVYGAFVGKAFSYIQGGENGSELQSWFQAADSSGFLTLTKIAGALSSLIFIYLAISTIHNSLLTDKNKSLLLFIMMISIIVILLTFLSGTTWLRFYFVLYFFIPILFYYSLQEKKLRLRPLFALFWLTFLIWNVILQVSTLNQQTVITTFLKNIFLYPINGFIS